MPDPGLDFILSDQYLTGSYSHPNPAYDYITAFLPRKLKDYFRWSEYLYANSPQVFATVQKFAAYCVSDVKVSSKDENDPSVSKKVLDKYKAIFKKIHIQNILIQTALNTLVYNNVFVNILPSISRMLVCTNCGARYPISAVNYKFHPNSKSYLFSVECKKCRSMYPAKVLDLHEINTDKPFNVIFWDPKFIDIEYNKYTGDEVVYATIDGSTITQIKKGNKLFIEKLDMGIIETSLSQDKMFRFDPRFMKHIKTPSLAGLEQQWGYPALISTLKPFLYAAILRKANEAIAFDYLIPLRIVFPTSSGTFDPTQVINLEKWKDAFVKGVKQWRRDPLHIEIAPVPVGRVQVGGEGRSLLTMQEISVAEDNILAAMGIPREIISGSLQWKAAPITLRLLAKQLEPLIGQLNDLVQWIADGIAMLEKLPQVSVEMVPFKMIDDSDEKMILLQNLMSPQLGSLVSAKTIGETIGIDVEKEQEQIMKEMVENKRREVKVMADMNRVSQEEMLASQQSGQSSVAAGMSGSSQTENSILAEAQGYVDQLLSVDPSSRKKTLTDIKRSRPVLHAVIIQLLQDAREQMEYQGRKQINPNA